MHSGAPKQNLKPTTQKEKEATLAARRVSTGTVINMLWMHSLLDNCAERLRLMSYENFMIFMRGKVHNIMAAIFILLYDFFKLNEVMLSGSEESSPETIRCLLS